MDKDIVERLVNKPPEHIAQSGIEMMAKIENDWLSLPEDARSSILIETVDYATIASTLPISQALLAMLRVGYCLGRRDGR